MTNRFKFKFYDKTKNILEYIHTWDFEHGVLQYINNKGDIKDLKTTKNVVIMQSTGLTDKNGKEIFEGDVLESILSDGSRIIHFIEYNQDTASFNAVNKQRDICCKLEKEWVKKKEVIGNVYENEYLIKEV